MSKGIDLYLVDTGVILGEDNAEYDEYNIVYDKKRGYYDVAQCFFRNKEEAIKEAKGYVMSSPDDMVYAIVTRQSGFPEDITEQEIDEVELDGSSYDVNDVVYCIKQEHGIIEQNFMGKPTKFKACRTLTTEEWNAVQLVLTRTNMDCWCFLKEDKNGNAYVYDLEERKKVSLRKAMQWVAEGIDNEEVFANCKLSHDEQTAFIALLNKLHIELHNVVILN